jgi:hypothetical protein
VMRDGDHAWSAKASRPRRPRPALEAASVLD